MATSLPPPPAAPEERRNRFEPFGAELIFLYAPIPVLLPPLLPILVGSFLSFAREFGVRLVDEFLLRLVVGINALRSDDLFEVIGRQRLRAAARRQRQSNAPFAGGPDREKRSRRIRRPEYLRVLSQVRILIALDPLHLLSRLIEPEKRDARLELPCPFVEGEDAVAGLECLHLADVPFVRLGIRIGNRLHLYRLVGHADIAAGEEPAVLDNHGDLLPRLKADRLVRNSRGIAASRGRCVPAAAASGLVA